MVTSEEKITVLEEIIGKAKELDKPRIIERANNEIKQLKTQLEEEHTIQS